MIDNHPAALRRRLTAALRRLRSEAGRTQRDVAKTLGWSPSKIIRIEQGDVGISVADLWALLRLYSVDDAQITNDLEVLARGSRRMPYTEYADVVSSEELKYFRYEASASVIRQVALNVIPGLLQTDAYAQSVFEARHFDEATSAKLIASRHARQEVLAGTGAPESFFIIDEGAMRRLVGGAEVMREQWNHLSEMSRSARVTIQFLPFDSGAHPALAGPFNLLEFAGDDDPDVLFIEEPTGAVLLRDDLDLTATYRERFWEIEDLSTDLANFTLP